MRRILIVEPDKLLAETIKKYLIGFEVELSFNSQEALLVSDKFKPELIILELAIPENNGMAFMHEFRSYTDWVDVPIIIYSHIPQEDTGLDEAEWRKQGAATYLYKPTNSLANLKQNINQILNIYETN